MPKWWQEKRRKVSAFIIMAFQGVRKSAKLKKPRKRRSSIMKKILSFLTLAVMLFTLSPARTASAGITQKIDKALTKYWAEGRAEKNLHILDNGTLAYFYDINHGERMVGIVSSFYTFKHFSAEWGVIRSIEADKSGFPIVGVNYKIGAHLAGYGWVRTITYPIKRISPILRMTNIGTFGGRDFNASTYRYGLYAGLFQDFSTEDLEKLFTEMVESVKKMLPEHK